MAGGADLCPACALLMVGVAGWSLVALGFLTVALAALWSSRPRERRPSFWPYRPQGLVRVAVKSRRRR